MAASHPSPVLEVEGLGLVLQGRRLLEEVDLTLAPGEIVGVVGPNGAGKTTLFRMISGQEQPDSGRIDVGETVKLA